MENEIWKPVVGYEGLYEVSNLGNVRSLNFHKEGKIQCLMPGINRGGYKRVLLYKNGKRRSRTIHTIVAEAFIPNPKNLKTVNHKNEIKTDNSVENLEWMSARDNVLYGTRVDRMAKNRSKPILQFSEEGYLLKCWSSAVEIKEQLGYSRSFISQCCTGKRKTAHGFIWKFKE